MRSIKAAWNWFCTTPASLAAAFLALGLIAGLAAGSFSLDDCAIKPLQERVTDCSFRDWLERWQTIVGSVFAVVAAAVVAWPVFRQLAETQRQAAAAGILIIRDAAKDVEVELDKFDACVALVRPVLKALLHETGRVEESILSEARLALSDLANSMVFHLRHNPVEPGDGSSLRVVRRDTQVMCNNFHDQLVTLRVAQIAMNSAVSSLLGEFEPIRSDTMQRADEWIQLAQKYRNGLEQAARGYWLRAGELERLATEPS